MLERLDNKTLRLIRHLLESCWLGVPGSIHTKKVFHPPVAIKNIEAALELLKQADLDKMDDTECKTELRDNLQAVRDFFKFQANSPGGLAANIDYLLDDDKGEL